MSMDHIFRLGLRQNNDCYLNINNNYIRIADFYSTLSYENGVVKVLCAIKVQ